MIFILYVYEIRLKRNFENLAEVCYCFDTACGSRRLSLFPFPIDINSDLLHVRHKTSASCLFGIVT